jgi:3-oxoacyl-[acyl-carrier protein] reductase
MGRLEGEVALVTGATSGLGAVVARRFAAEGAAVVVTGRDPGRGAAVVESIAAGGGRATFLAADLRSAPTTVPGLVASAVEAYGALTVLVNNAVAHTAGDGPAERVEAAAWLEILQVDLLAAAELIKHAVPHLRAAGHGSIVNVSSRAASHGTPGHAAYSAAKGALESLTRSVAVDYAGDGIRCNAVRPGYVLHEVRDAGIDEDRRARIAAAQLTRPVTADDVAATCLWLASAESAAITGLVVPVDGGNTSARAMVIG